MVKISSLFIFMCFIVVPCLGQENYQLQMAKKEEAVDILLKDPYLSVLYQRGSYLVYNCIDKHWVCTAKAEYQACIEKRNYALEENEIKLPCAPVEKFKDEESCNEYQARLTEFNMENRFCLHPSRSFIERNF